MSGPQVVVFEDPSQRKAGSGGTKHDWKSFMSSKISKINEKPPPPKTVKEQLEEEEDITQDKALKELLDSSNLIEKLTTEDLSGKDRRKYMQQKLVELGGKAAKLPKVPLGIHIGMQAKQKSRATKALKDAKEQGMFHDSIKHQFDALKKPKEKGFRQDRGIKGSIGKYKDGVLHISDKDIKRIENTGKVQKRGGKGGRGGRGGSRGGGGGGRGGSRGGRGGGGGGRGGSRGGRGGRGRK